MPQLPEILETLLRLGNLEQVEPSRVDVLQYLKNAQHMLQDSQLVGVSTHGRFTFAYEGLNAIAMGVYQHYQVRPHSVGGHRSTAMGQLAALLGIDDEIPGSAHVITTAHARRNETSYNKPYPPVSKAQADALVKVLEVALPRMMRLVKSSDTDV